MARSSLLVALLVVWVAVPALGVVSGAIFFQDPGSFRNFNIADGKVPKGTETFEESNIPPGGKQVLPGPFCAGLPNVDPQTGYGFPSGLAEANLCLYDNVTPGPAPAQLNPSGNQQALYVIGQGFINSNSKKVGEDLFLQGIQASIDLVFNPHDHTGVGFWLSRFDGFGSAGWTVSVFDTNNVLVGVTNVPAPAFNEPSKTFLGVWSPNIGRINIWDPIVAPDAIDDIEMWVPEPASLSLLAIGSLMLLRRRR